MSFPIVLRGYARPQVDAHLATLDAQLQQAVQRAEQATAERDQAQAALEQLRAQEAEPALAADPPRSTQPIPLGTQLLRDETTVVATLSPSGEGRAPQPLPGPRVAAPTRRRSRTPVAVAAVLALVGAGAFALTRDREPAATAQAAPPSPAASALSGTTAPQAARVAPAEPVVLPDGWTTHRSPDGLWSIGLPPGWRVEGDEFVSASGLTSMSVRTDQTDPQEYEKAFAAGHLGYERIGAQELAFRGYRAGTWDYTYGSGELEQRGSDLALRAGDRGYWLHVVSRASAWEFAEPLVDGFRSSFAPTP